MRQNSIRFDWRWFEAVDWEQKGLTALSSERGVLAARAIDQRGAAHRSAFLNQ
jgi:tagatose-1,6-bisphosphate aldolase